MLVRSLGRGGGRRSQAGFSLIEALVAMVILAFGMLAIAGLQATLSRNSDNAKQRTEAVRLAQQKMEELRSFDGVTSGSYTYGANVVAGTDTLTPAGSNTTFTRTWTVKRADGATDAVATDAQKWIHVTVDWADRQGNSQPTPVALHSVIARNDPIAIKGLVAEQAKTRIRLPKNRSLNIPYPAVGTSNPNRSAFIPPPGAVTYVFDNVTGKIVQSCTGVTDLVEGIDLSSYSCVTLNAYLLSGYVRFVDTNSQPSADDLINPNGTTRELNTSTPLTIDSTATGNGPSAHTCYAQRQKVVSASNLSPVAITSLSRSGGVVTLTTASAHGYSAGLVVTIKNTSNFLFEGQFEVVSVPSATTLTYLQPGTDATATGGTLELLQQLTLAETDTVPSGYAGAPVSTFVAWACIVTPVDDDSDSATPEAWWGQLNLVPSGWTLGNTYSAGDPRYTVCRYSSDYKEDGAVSNSEHPRYYRRVTDSLDNQNFVVIRGDQTCPTDIAPNYSGSTLGSLFNTNTVFHQDGGFNAAGLSFRCDNASCSGAQRVVIESSTATSPILME